MTNNLCADNRQPLVSVIIPVLNESGHIEHCLRQFHDRDSRVVEIVVVDGGSADNTVALAAPLADRVLVSGDCRSAQMNAGVRAASGQWLIFLHADTRLPRRFDSLLDCLSTTEYVWGFCRVKLSGRNRMFRVIETAINWRSQITSVATGDQMMFVRKALFDQLHGFPEIPLMEDVAISKKLKRRSSAMVWPDPVITSSRKWEKNGTVNTVLLMWRLRLAYFLGASPATLADEYYGK